MKGRRRHPALLVCSTILLLLLIPVGMTAAALYDQQRQDHLNRALIAAVKANDTNSAITLLKQGADANAREEEQPEGSFWQRMAAMVDNGDDAGEPKPSEPPVLMLAIVGDKDRALPETVVLLRALLEHGADPNWH